jgi:fumarylpyruvate hydrolase
MSFAVPAFAPPTLPVAGSDERFPVRRIYCIGRNYAAHAREMGADEREPPFFFLKPADAVLPVVDGETGAMAYPTLTSNLHHEIELVVAIGTGGRDIPVKGALDHVLGYAVGNDLTRRDLQFSAREQGRPWDVSKGFDASAPVSAIRLASDMGHPAGGAIWLEVNGETRQRANLSEMIWSVSEIVAELSTYFDLRPGDLIFTGTPEGVGPVQQGDSLVGGIDGLETLRTTIV